jgi:hypothetical protein
MKKYIALLLTLVCVLALFGCSKAEEEKTVAATTDNIEVIATIETEAQTELAVAHTLDLEWLEVACADGFYDPSTVTVLGGEWAYTADPNKFVVLATVNKTNKFDEYETADYVMVGVFGGEIELYHCLNQHSPYTRENALEVYGAVDDRRFPLE